jgi:hypothetical protein
MSTAVVKDFSYVMYRRTFSFKCMCEKIYNKEYCVFENMLLLCKLNRHTQEELGIVYSDFEP